MNLIVTGANGSLGQHLMTHLRALGHDPYCVTRAAYDLRNPDPNRFKGEPTIQDL